MLMQTNICKEALVWKGLRHPFILPFLGIDTETFGVKYICENGLVCLVSPWMKNGTALAYLKTNGLSEVDRLVSRAPPTQISVSYIYRSSWKLPKALISFIHFTSCTATCAERIFSYPIVAVHVSPILVLPPSPGWRQQWNRIPLPAFPGPPRSSLIQAPLGAADASARLRAMYTPLRVYVSRQVASNVHDLKF
jgi:hypothetical protein